MSNFVFNIIGSIGIFCAFVYIWSYLLDKHIDYKSIRFYFVFLSIVAIIVFNFLYTTVYLRIILITIILGIANFLLFSADIKSTFVSTVLSEFIFSVADISFGLIVLYLLKIDLNNLSSFFGTFIANIYAFVVSILIVRCKFIKHFFDFLMQLVDNITKKRVIFLSFVIIVSLNLLLALVFFELSTYYVFIINIVLMLIYSFIIVKNLETSSKNKTMEMQNDYLMDSLHQYEDMVDRQRVDNHENKNQLLVIKNMIKKNDKGVVKYIDSVIKNQKEDDEVLYTRVKTIPSGGLQGIIYQKMLVMKDKNILFSLDVSRDVRKIELDMLNSDDNYNLCRIMGVLLDNAIEGSSTCDDKRIMISLYVDDDMLVIEVSNNYDGELDDDLLDSEGFTTKGNGHGYGLCLVKDIVSNSKIFINDRKISNGVFHQIIKVVIKNT